MVISFHYMTYQLDCYLMIKQTFKNTHTHANFPFLFLTISSQQPRNPPVLTFCWDIKIKQILPTSSVYQISSTVRVCRSCTYADTHTHTCIYSNFFLFPYFSNVSYNTSLHILCLSAMVISLHLLIM